MIAIGCYRQDLLTRASSAFEVASRSTSILEENCRVVFEALGVLGRRNHVLVVDETVFAPRWEVAVDLREGCPWGYIGGFKSPDEDFSFMPASLSQSELPEDKLSRMSVHYGFSRADSNRHFFEVDMIPRCPRKGSASESKAGAAATLAEFGAVMLAATKANHGLPPSSGAMDGGGANSYINNCLLGVLPDELMHVPFFDQCQKQNLKIPAFPYKALFFQGKHFVGGNNDCCHIMKRLSFHIASGVRTPRWGDVFINLSWMTQGGLPVRSLATEDLQSDKDMAKRLNSFYVVPGWGGAGCLVAQFIFGLVTSSWTAARGVEFKEGLQNALVSYYAILIQTHQSMERYGRGFQKHWLPIQSIRNVLDLAAHIIIQSRHWPAETPWRPQSRQESAIEWHFGQAKTVTCGSPTVKDLLYGVYMVHGKHLRESSIWDDFTRETIEPVSAQELLSMAESALDGAASFQELSEGWG